jgi:lipoate-protein ligase B
MKEVRVIFLGRTKYDEAWELQRETVERRRTGGAPDTLLLTEHDHVYTIGKGGNDLHLLAGERELREKGIEVYHNDRGGDVTYHGPGQLVGYPILDLTGFTPDLHHYLRDLEEVIIRAIGAYGVRGERIEDYTGVWVGGEKICAIGIKSSRWITMHGFALNVTTDLSYFRRIIPCGIFERGVTSLAEILGREVPLDEVVGRVTEEFGRVFGATMRESAPAEILREGPSGDELRNHAIAAPERNNQNMIGA